MTFKMKHHLAGQVFGRLTVGAYVGGGKWQCTCSCGALTIKVANNLLAGASRSCGCLNREVASARNTKHGGHGTLTYWIWMDMRVRCSRSTHQNYKNYGGRGIAVCDRWNSSFANFLADMGECPPGLSIDRENVNGNYESSNCRWIPLDQQASTKRTAQHKRAVTPEVFRLRELGHSQQQIADATGIHQATVSRVLAAPVGASA